MGQKSAAYSDSGDILAFYDSVDSPAPGDATALPLTDDEWRAAIANNGYRVRDGVLTPPNEPTEAELLARAESAKTSELYTACSSAITSGYSSSALGTLHSYPNGSTDQTNMLGSVTDSLLPDLPDGWTTPFWCADGNGAWAMREHTAAQIQRAGADGKAWVVACQQKLTGLVAQVQAAETVTGVEAITWD